MCLRVPDFRLLRVPLLSNCVLSLPASLCPASPLFSCVCVCALHYPEAAEATPTPTQLHIGTAASASDFPLPNSQFRIRIRSDGASARTSACCGRCLPASSLLVLLKLRARTVRRRPAPVPVPVPDPLVARSSNSTLASALGSSLEHFFVCLCLCRYRCVRVGRRTLTCLLTACRKLSAAAAAAGVA